MAILRSREAGLALFLALGLILYAEPAEIPSSRVCPMLSVKDSIFASQSTFLCPVNAIESFYFHGVIEGEEATLQRALAMVHKRTHSYIAVLFYASWCPFSAAFRPNFSVLSSFFPSVPHFAIEESAIRPSMLSKYGVHGFPTLFLLNSTMRVRYQGPRTIDSLISFYGDITGIDTTSVDGKSLDKMGCLSNNQNHTLSDKESCPFSWARSPENLFRQETYLALATAYVVLRLLYAFFPILQRLAFSSWRRYVANLRFRTLLEHPPAYLNRAVHLFNSLKEPCKRSNLQALNAKRWASKSLASVSFGDASTSRVTPVS